MPRAERAGREACAELSILDSDHQRLHRPPCCVCSANSILQSRRTRVGVHDVDPAADAGDEHRVWLHVELEPPRDVTHRLAAGPAAAVVVAR